MPKLKTNRGAKKRFKLTGKGQIKHRGANRAHILTKKSNKRKRQLRGMRDVCAADRESVLRMLGKV